jgi:hypothetical protein
MSIRNGVVRWLGLTGPEWMALLLVVFFVAFPKGGFRAGPIPITWGYILLAIAIMAALPFWLLRANFRFLPEEWFAGTSGLPFLVVIVIAILTKGIADAGSTVQMFISFGVLPLAMVFLFPACITHQVSLDWTLKLMRGCMFFAAVYGIFLFFYHIEEKKFIEIPFLTVNAGDAGQMESTKHIDRGGLFKLISTYNNGNVYGVSTLILLPLYDFLEPRKWRRYLIRAALILTLSRTVWMGMLALQFMYFLREFFKDASAFPTLRLGRSVKSALLLLPVGIFIGTGMAILSSRGVAGVLDPNLGGRLEQIQALDKVRLFPFAPAQGFAEVVYTSAAVYYGLLGLVGMLWVLFLPLWLVRLKRLRQNKLGIAAWMGLMLYPVLGCIDGAMDFIPVMAFYWFAYMIFLYADVIERRDLAHFRQPTSLLESHSDPFGVNHAP